MTRVGKKAAGALLDGRGHRDRLQLYTGMRTKQCLKLVDPDPVCKSVYAIKIDFFGIELDGVRVAPPVAAAIAHDDGFTSVEEFVSFFADHYGLPFHGFKIAWEPPE